MPPARHGVLLRTRAAAAQRLLSFVMGWPRLRNRFAARHAAPVDGRTLDPQLAVLVGLGDLVDPEPELSRFAPAKARARLIEQVATVEAPPPPGVRTGERSLPGPAGSLTVRLYTPEGLPAPSPAVFYLHGGGWVTCGLDTHDAFCQRLALGARCRVVAVDYRLAPEHRFPAAVEDSLAAFRWMMGQAEALGIDPTRVAVAGDSAGGNLSAVLSLRTREEARRPALQVLLYPAVDATRALPSHQHFKEGYFLTGAMIDWYYGHYLGGTEHLRHPDVSPLFAPDVRGAPEALVYTAGFDTLRDEGRAYADKLREAGVPVVYREFESLVHGFTLMTGAIDSARKAVEEIAAEVGRRLTGARA